MATSTALSSMKDLPIIMLAAPHDKRFALGQEKPVARPVTLSSTSVSDNLRTRVFSDFEALFWYIITSANVFANVDWLARSLSIAAERYMIENSGKRKQYSYRDLYENIKLELDTVKDDQQLTTEFMQLCASWIATTNQFPDLEVGAGSSINSQATHASTSAASSVAKAAPAEAAPAKAAKASNSFAALMAEAKSGSSTAASPPSVAPSAPSSVGMKAKVAGPPSNAQVQPANTSTPTVAPRTTMVRPIMNPAPYVAPSTTPTAQSTSGAAATTTSTITPRDVQSDAEDMDWECCVEPSDEMDIDEEYPSAMIADEDTEMLDDDNTPSDPYTVPPEVREELFNNLKSVVANMAQCYNGPDRDQFLHFLFHKVDDLVLQIEDEIFNELIFQREQQCLDDQDQLNWYVAAGRARLEQLMDPSCLMSVVGNYVHSFSG